MSYLEPGVTGAKRVSFRRSNPRELLRTLVERHPTVPDGDLLKIFEEAVLDGDSSCISAIVEYYFTNHLRSLRGREPRRSRVTPRQVEFSNALEESKRLVQRAVEARVEVVLLDMMLPHGKALRDCTGLECAKAGGWLAKLSAQVKPRQVIGKVLSEDQVRKLYEAS